MNLPKKSKDEVLTKIDKELGTKGKMTFAVFFEICTNDLLMS